MKTIHERMLLILAVLTAFAAVAENPAGQTVRRHPKARPTGGILVKDRPKSVIMLRNRQSSYKAEEIAAAVRNIERATCLPIVCVAADGQLTNATVEVVLEEKLASGRKVLAAPQDGWAAMGVDWLLADSPAADVRARRLYLALIREIGMAMGVGISMYQPCIMSDVRTVRELDRIKLNKYGPEGENNFEVGMKLYGLSKIRFTTYRTACQQGWAPAPTNDIQKAIWEEVHTLPKTPMKIEFDPKKGK